MTREAPTAAPCPPIRVLSAPGPGGRSVNNTVTMLVEALPDSVEVVPFSWKRVLFTQYDVLHVHWPEYLLRHRPRRPAAIKRALFVLMLARTALRRIPTVWTVHNERPHDDVSRVVRLLLHLWARRATRRVYMYESALPSSPGERDVCIPRGDYEPTYGALRRRDPGGRPSNGRLLLFGVLRPYKGIERLVEVVRDADGEKLELLVAGDAYDESYARDLVATADGAANVTVRIGLLSDEELAGVIQSSALVVLPYRKMYNSGAALLALTLHRPILVPSSPTMRELQAEVGADWVFLYEGALTADDLLRAMRALETSPASAPDLSRRDWGHVGRSYAALYRSIVRFRSASVPRDPGLAAHAGRRPDGYGPGSARSAAHWRKSMRLGRSAVDSRTSSGQ